MKVAIYISIVIMCFSLLFSLPSSATAGTGNNRRGQLSVSEIQVQIVGDSIELCFNCKPALFAPKGKERIIVTPVISNGINRAAFPPFIIVTKKGKISFIRSSDYQRDMKMDSSRQMFVYKKAVKYETWMRGSTLSFESCIKSCSKRAKLTTAIVCRKILQNPEVKSKFPH
mgnify:FL=1